MAQTPDRVSVTVVPNTPPPSPVSPKVWAATVGSLVASLAVALLSALIDNPQALDFLPAWAKLAALAMLPVLVTFAAGYVKRDTTRELGQAVQNKLHTPDAEVRPGEAENFTVSEPAPDYDDVTLAEQMDPGAAWDDGYRAGHSNAMRRMSDEPNAPTSPNPYRGEHRAQ